MSDDSDFFSPEEFKEQEMRPFVEEILESKSAKLRALGLLASMDVVGAEMGLEGVDKIRVAQTMKDEKIFDVREAMERVYPGDSGSSQPQNDEPITRETLGDRIGASLGGQRVEPQPTQPKGDGEESFVDAMKRRMGVA